MIARRFGQSYAVRLIRRRRPMKIGARNQIIGKVTEVKKGSIMCQVKLDVPASKMASVMTLDSAEEMGLKKGDRVRVVVKAIHVLLMKE
jgi:molybdopterin-binding protein